MGIERQEAAEALNDIAQIAQRVRQSRIYQLSSSLMVMWGALVIVGNIGSFVWPRSAGFLWLGVHAIGIAGSFTISALGYSRTGTRTLDNRMLIAFLLFIAFGIFSCWLGNFNTARQIGTFWAIYFMLIYTIAGLWVGHAYVAIGLSITALTLIGYGFAGEWFEPWMAVVNGGGLILGGLWMRRN
ncbi:MAG: hypothetical protein ACJ8DE_09025 [Microvirga sp.]